jgi:hypothetical protein
MSMPFQILSETGFWECLDAFAMRLGPIHHSPAPPVRNDAFIVISAEGSAFDGAL